MPRQVRIAAEDFLGIALMSRLARDAGLEPGTDAIRTRGRDEFLRRVGNFNAAAERFPWIVCCDLDNAPCVADFVRAAVPHPGRLLCFRVAIREAEAWLLADQAAAEGHFGIRLRATDDWDRSPDPKLSFLRGLAESSDRAVRKSMVLVKQGGRLTIGPEYNTRAAEFVSTIWRTDRAAERSESLARARQRIAELAKRLRAGRSTRD